MNLVTTIACKLTIQFLLDPLLTFLHLMTDLLTHMQRTELDQSIEEQDSVPELPEIPQLQHLAKNRPKRPKKHASTKNVLKVKKMIEVKWLNSHFVSWLRVGTVRISKKVWILSLQSRLHPTKHQSEVPYLKSCMVAAMAHSPQLLPQALLPGLGRI